MTVDETQIFRLLDSYSRNRHNCFLAEMFLNKQGTEYFLCFRPVTSSRESSKAFAHRYLRVDRDQALGMGHANVLTKSTTEMLDHELSILSARSNE